MAQGERGAPGPGVKTKAHLEENLRAADLRLATQDIADIDRRARPAQPRARVI